ncbi:MAG: class IV adenylate cyclase, partial [bacterium]
FTITLDRVAGIGDFAEVELLIPDASQAQAAADSIEALARHLKLGDVERKSYLALVRASQKIDSAT